MIKSVYKINLVSYCNVILNFHVLVSMMIMQNFSLKQRRVKCFEQSPFNTF